MARTLDEILTTEMPDVVTQAREKAEQMRLEIHINQLREVLTQAGTEPMICGQTPSLQDVTLMDLKRWVEAAGGKLQLNVELPNGTHTSFTV
ncbi:transcriptional regulator [Aeromonas hydrophila]|uniref:transcriptional regulator n=1 Tax=Aeromonas hydrophila TaxID=644 RepID=UPI001A1823B8|nr:transcriptional regulator [Aeromonas hydrophila]HAT2416165.1 transcriptional regulator [Aeromonas hydrophila]HAT2574100.1 transcriptional regulator [Aeromonas hydrophila]HAT2579052.1 transcriptional regulator [Aeromonas hydrophila]HAT2638462.1 transcriptional regulator [Aeromonas hydrophila]